jgi:vacuolar-type H+-ATPase subunit H
VSPEGPASRRQIEDTTAARLAEIVAAAETAAKQVIDEAEAEARERLADATEEADRIVAERLDRLAGLTEELDLQAEALKRGAEALRAALAEARAELGGGEPAVTSREADDPAPEPRRPTGPSLTVVGGVDPRDAEPFTGTHDGGEDRFAPLPRTDSSPSPEADFEPASNGTPAGARLLATQMAVSGSSREEIAQRLRSGFAISDTASILDAILGPER